MKQKITKIINYLNLVSLIYLCATSILYFQFQRFAFYSFFITYFIELILEKKWVNVKIDKKRLYYLVLAFFCLLALIYHPFENSSVYFKTLFDRRLALIGFAIVGFFGLNNLHKFNYIINTIIITSVFSSLYLIFIRIGVVEFITNPSRSDLFRIERIQYINSHMIFNVFLNISLVGIWFLLTRFFRDFKWWQNSFYIFSLILILGLLLISEGRAGFITALLLMFVIAVFESWKKNKILGIILGLVVPILLFVVVSRHERMSEGLIKTEPRIFLWEAATNVIKEKPIFGYGISSAQEHYDIERDRMDTINYKQTWSTERVLHAENQFFQTTLEFGFFGLLILLFLFSCPVFIVDKSKMLFSFLILIPFVYQSLFDVVITGVNYATIFGFALLLILSTEPELKEKKE